MSDMQVEQVSLDVVANKGNAEQKESSGDAHMLAVCFC